MNNLLFVLFSPVLHKISALNFKFLFQAPFLESSKADEPLIKSSLCSVCSSIDLYSDLAGDTTWGGQNPNLMDETSSKSIGHHTGLSDMRKGKNVLLQPTTLSTISVYRQVPSQSLPKHGSLHEIASKLDALSEEGENDSETDEQSVSGSSDRSSSGTPNLFQVKLDSFGIDKISARLYFYAGRPILFVPGIWFFIGCAGLQ